MPMDTTHNIAGLPAEALAKAGVLIEALPYIQNFYDKTVVIKYGGAAMTDTSIRRSVLQDVVFMSYVGMRPILVHGGGPFVSKRMEALGKASTFVKGFRVTDAETMKIAEEEFTRINHDIVRELISLGASALSLSGKDDRLIEVRKHADIDGQDIGFVGEITKVNGDVIQRMMVSDIIPVIPPIGVGAEDGETYNINADQVAASIAGALAALKLVLLTDVGGIYKDIAEPSSLIPHATTADVAELIQTGVISGGMIPKVKACTHALELGVAKTHIIDAKIPHGLLLEIFTDKGIGTEIVKTV